MNYNPKIVICDSGLSDDLLKKVHSIDIGHGIKDDNGHGSALSDIILRYGCSPELTSIKVLDRNCSTDLECLYNALIKCTELDADIICLALSLENDNIIPELRDIIRLLHSQGKIIISSLHNRAEHSYPAVFSEVIGVRNTAFDKREYSFFNKLSNIQCSIPAKPIIYGNLNDNYGWITGSSLSTGILVSHISSLFSGHGKYSFTELCDILSSQSVEDIAIISQQNKRLDTLMDYSDMDFIHLAEQLREFGFTDDKPLYDQTNDMNIIIYLIDQFTAQKQLAPKMALACTDDLRSFSSFYNYLIKECLA